MPKALAPILSYASRAQAGPFLKWAGGKRQLLPLLLDAAPASIETYYEPFIGGGAHFFALHTAGRFRQAVLADRNQELIDCYQAVKDNVDGVIAQLRTKSFRHSKAAYYEMRKADPTKMDLVERAARTIYLNKTGFNGLYRVNSSGLFNVPFGSYVRPNICDEPRLKAASEALQNAELVCADFQLSIAKAKKTDFVYFDPPYVPLSATSSFTAYGELPFGTPEQERLAETLRVLGDRRVPALLSNSDCPTTRALYKGKGLAFDEVEVRRAINSVAARRGSVGELLVKSFPFRREPDTL
jgi:DNA adenine methylase